jgi:hypothetical protein
MGAVIVGILSLPKLNGTGAVEALEKGGATPVSSMVRINEF